jgi:hypothetical protein
VLLFANKNDGIKTKSRKDSGTFIFLHFLINDYENIFHNSVNSQYIRERERERERMGNTTIGTSLAVGE